MLRGGCGTQIRARKIIGQQFLPAKLNQAINSPCVHRCSRQMITDLADAARIPSEMADAASRALRGVTETQP